MENNNLYVLLIETDTLVGHTQLSSDPYASKSETHMRSIWLQRRTITSRQWMQPSRWQSMPPVCWCWVNDANDCHLFVCPPCFASNPVRREGTHTWLCTSPEYTVLLNLLLQAWIVWQTDLWGVIDKVHNIRLCRFECWMFLWMRIIRYYLIVAYCTDINKGFTFLLTFCLNV